LRILFVTAAYLPQSIGGVELHVSGIAAAMRAAGHEVAVFTRGADPARAEFSLERTRHDAAAVYRVDYKFSDCADFGWIVVNPNLRAIFESVLGEWNPDVVHVHHLTCLSTDLVDAARERGIPVVMTLHDFWMGCPRGQRMTPELELCETIDLAKCAPCLTKMWSGWFGIGRDGAQAPEAERAARDREQLARYHGWIRDLLLRVDQLVTPSESSRQVFGSQGIPAEKIRVVANGLDVTPFRPIARAERRVDAPFRFGYLGSVLPTKGVHVLIEAFARLHAAGDRNSRLDVYGELLGWHEITDYEARLRALAAPLGGAVTFHGRYEIAAAPSILAGMDALVVPSLWREAFCLTLREGFLAGVPVIVSGHGAMLEALPRGDEALTFRPGDAADLAAKMAQLRDDAALRARLTKAPKQVRTIEDNAAELAGIYAEVIAMRSAARASTPRGGSSTGDRR
jgi:glycosyltransferase involved in cell wall biosynthesis